MIVMRQNNLPYFLNQAKISYYRTQPYYKYGYQVPCNYEEFIELDEMHGNLQCRYLEYWDGAAWSIQYILRPW